MKKVLLLLAFQIGCFVQVHAQHLAGYLGKQLILNGDLETLIRVRTAAKDGGLPINLKLGAGIEFILTRYTSVGFEYGQFRTGFETLLPYLERNNFDETYLSHSKVTLGSQVQSYGVFYTLFNRDRGYLAPYGRYQIVGAKLLSITEKDFRKSLDDFGQAHDIHLTDPQTSTYAYGLLYGIGKKWIYFDHLIVDVRFQMCLVINKKFKPGIFLNNSVLQPDYDIYTNSGSYPYDENTTDFKLTVEDDMVKRVALHSMFDVHFGIGWLLF